ncbi:MAG: hypothetical protein PVG66_01135 [Chromatiales bacterium]|jgi:hypothetical protein
MENEKNELYQYKPTRVIEEIKDSRILVLLLVGIICLFVGNVWDSSYTSRKNEKLIHLYEKVKDGDAKPIDFIQYNQGMFKQEKTWINLLKEIGFASLIALVLIVANEITSHNRHMASALRIQRIISNNVFKGIFGINTPESIVDEAITTVFRAPILRRDVEIQIHCQNLPSELDEYVGRHMLVEIYMTYEIENTSVSTLSDYIPLTYDSYEEEILDNLCGIEYAVIGDKEYSTLEEIRKCLLDMDQNDCLERKHLFPYRLDPNSKLHVAFRYKVIKEVGDSELWTNVYPTLGARISIEMPQDDKIYEYGVRARHRENIEPMKGTTNTWHLTSPLLPFQAVSIWWRPKISINSSTQS